MTPQHDDLGWWPDWTLFGDTIATGLVLAALLPRLGVLLVARQQVFTAAAVGQAATFGSAVVLAAGIAHDHGDGTGHLAVVGGAQLAAIATAVLALRALSAGRSTLEARNALVFLGAGAAAVLLLAHAPHGLQEVQRLFLSSLLAVERVDLLLVLAAAAVTTGLGALRPRQIAAWAFDPQTAAAHGVPVARYDLLGGIVLGAVLGHAIHATGLVFTFGAAVLPVLAAREVAGSLRAVCWLAPALGVLGQVLAFALAHRFDLPPAQVAVAVFAATTAVLRVAGRLRVGPAVGRVSA
jgi:ABC-type Mn2+/Zn2+ transport system permease subunit